MPINRVLVWISGQILYASDLNTEFNNTNNNAVNDVGAMSRAAGDVLVRLNNLMWGVLPIGVAGQLLQVSPTGSIQWGTPINFGTATINFGAFPGSPETTLAVTGQTAIVVSSRVLTWVEPIATAEHSMDEHAIEHLKVSATNIIPGTGFTIYAQCELGKWLYGHYSVGWVWV